MSSAPEVDKAPAGPSVFVSYASQDRAAAGLIRDALAAAGLDVWLDEEELAGGDAWDHKIRRQIRECDYFMPVISAQTEGRPEGYFRREWRLAVERTLDMADDHPFLLPVVIDGTDQATARVPEKFLAVQWLRAPDGRPTPGLTALCTRLRSGAAPLKAYPGRERAGPGDGRTAAVARGLPAFPTEEPGQRVKFWFHVVGWTLESGWIIFKRLPRWIRLVAYFWIALLVLSRGCPRRPATNVTIAPEKAQKLKEIADKYQGSSKPGDIAKLGVEIAREFSRDADENLNEARPVLAIPFAAPADNPAEAKLANSTFALLFGRISISHSGQVGLGAGPLASLEVAAAAARGRENHSRYVLCGAIESRGAARVLTVDIVEVSGASVVWSKSFPVDGSDPATIAPEIEAAIPALDDN